MLVADVDWDKELIQSEDVTIWYLSTPSTDIAVVECDELGQRNEFKIEG